ncbi:protein translocase subunit SecD [Jatrophihabitans sp. YIM 134969]
MAPPAGTLRVGRYFLALGVLLAVLYAVTFWPGKGNTPKLGLDLVGGAQVVLQATTTDGSSPTRDAMNEARQIIEDRVNGRGVSNSEVAIEGSNRITVTIPGKKADEIDNIGTTALLTFRPLVAGPFPATPQATATPTASGSGATSGAATPPASQSASVAPTGTPTAAPSSSGASPQDNAARPLAAATTPSAPASGAAASTPASTPAASTPAPDPTATGSPAPTGVATVPGESAVTPQQVQAFQADPNNSSVPGASTLSSAQIQALIALKCGPNGTAESTSVIVACSQDRSAKYVLAPQLFPGTEVKTAQAVAPNAQTAAQGWVVALDLKSTGAKLWSDYTGAHNCGGTGCTATAPPANFVAFTLDGEVITAPGIQSAINGQTQITGNFTQTSAEDLANSLKYGALPLSFKELTSQTVSATLGTSQLEAGLLAGGIGLALVVIYSLLYYRGLGLVTLASLVVSGGIVYACLVILGRNINFTLTLAGVAGFIVAVGITADSFVVFFERIKDEVHEGRSMRVAVPRAWVRARRTVISADVVSLLAALVLYYLAAGEVRGFAFTLGLSTIIDVIVVFWFTHPLVSLLSRSRAFGSKRFTGLDAVRATPPPAKPGPGRRPVRPVATASARPSAGTTRIEKRPARSSVAVLDREDDEPAVTDEALDTTADTDVVVGDVAVETPDDTAVDTTDVEDATEPAPARRARRTTPESGSAAERAAARRAKLRNDEENGA